MGKKGQEVGCILNDTAFYKTLEKFSPLRKWDVDLWSPMTRRPVCSFWKTEQTSHSVTASESLRRVGALYCVMLWSTNYRCSELQLVKLTFPAPIKRKNFCFLSLLPRSADAH